MELTQLKKNHTYLITGAGGFIGSYVADFLLKQGCRVVGYDNLNSYYDVSLKLARVNALKKYENFIFYHKDLEDYEALTEVFQNQKIV